MWNVKNFQKLRASRYYSVYKFYEDYSKKDDLSGFIMMLDNIDIDKIRYKDKKELLKVLEYVFKNYRLYKVDSIYLSWFTFINKYTNFKVSEREYLILELIIRLKEQLWWYYMYHYNIYYNVALNYIENCKRYIIFHKILKDDKIKVLENTDPKFYNFPWSCLLNDRYSIDRENYMKLAK
jgi:hypothetical protein